jgi:hypothetical protein
VNEPASSPDERAGVSQQPATPHAAPLDYATPSAAEARKGRPTSVAELASLAVGMSVFFILVIRLTGMRPDHAEPGWIAAALLWSISVVLIATSFFMKDRYPTDRAWRRRSGVLCGVILLLSLGSGACPHARWVSVGSARFAYSGKLCGNPDRSKPLIPIPSLF